jgi:hypothetical protein
MTYHGPRERVASPRARMLDFSEEHKFAQRLIRAWCTDRLAPRVRDLESGTRPHEAYDAMREFSAAFGLGELARALVPPRGGAEPDAGASRGSDAGPSRSSHRQAGATRSAR